MLKMEISNSQIVIAGKVIEGESNLILAGAKVEIVEKPKKFSTILSLKALKYGSQWDKMSVRPDRKITASDGSFYFIDLPPGDYKLEVSMPGSGTRYKNGEQKVTVSSPINDRIPTVIKNIVLEPTGIQGTITNKAPPNEAILNAKVQIQGSPESTFSDQKGNYRLLGLDASKSGQRNVTLIISAIGYQPEIFPPLVIEQGKVISNRNFSLKQT